MNPTLAALYGTGMDKVAHDDEGYELSDLSDEELLLLADEMDYDDDGDEALLQKMASSGDAEYWDMAGRIMAHAYADEFDKVAGAEDPLDYFEGDIIDANYVDLNELDAEDLYELALTKEAGVLGRVGRGMRGAGRMAYGATDAVLSAPFRAGRAGLQAAGRQGRRISRSAPAAAMSGAVRGQGAAAVQGLKNAANRAVKFGNRMAAKAVKAGKGTAGFKGGKRALTMHSRGVAFQRFAGNMSPALTNMSPVQAGELATRIAMGGGAAAALGGAGAAAYGMSRNR